jgi:anti-sigma factor RsiW
VTCSWSEERFERYLDDDLTAAERTRLLAHLDACDGCRSLLDELRVVDGLLLQPRPIEPPVDFTAATMADVRALPPPQPPRSPLPAYLTCYVIGAWALIGAGFVLANGAMLAFGRTLGHVAQTIVVAVGGLAHVASHLGDRGDLSSWTTFAGGVVIADLVLLLALVAARRYAAPWLAQRTRS